MGPGSSPAEVLFEARTIAVVGSSANRTRPVLGVMRDLRAGRSAEAGRIAPAAGLAARGTTP